jgi:hypothetical protein
MGFKLKLFLAFFGGFAFCGVAYLFLMPISAENIQVEIENWYSKNANGYTISATSGAEKKGNSLNIDWHGMAVSIDFKKNMADITLHKDSLQAYFNNISIDKIQNRIASAGWAAYPQLAVSSYSEGVIFTDAEQGHINFKFTAEIFAVRADRNNEKCKQQREIKDSTLDNTLDNTCFVEVKKTIPFRLEMSAEVGQ